MRHSLSLPSGALMVWLAASLGGADTSNPTDATGAERTCAPGAAADEPELTPAEIVDLDDAAFADALRSFVWREPLPALDELQPLAERCAASRNKEFEFRFPCSVLAQEAVASASPDEDDWLWNLHDGLGSDSDLKRELVEAFLDRWLARMAAGLQLDPRPLGLEHAGEAPSHLATASSELLEAWRSYEGARWAFVHRAERVKSGEPEGSIPFHDDSSRLNAAIADYLRGDATPEATAASAGRFVWDSWCGTASAMLSEPQTKVLLATYLDRGRYDLAMGAALQLLSISGDSDDTVALVRAVLMGLGVDAEPLMLGALLSGVPGGLADLGRHGSERTARLLLEARRLPRASAPGRIGDDWRYMSTLAAFVSPSGPCEGYGTWSSLDVERGSSGPVSGDVEARILDLLAERVTPSAGLDDAKEASHLLVRLCRRESLPAFRDMARSRYSEVRERGVLALRALGEDVPDARPSAPVRFGLMVDGQPLAGTDVRWRIVAERRETSRIEAPDDQGVLHLERDRFLDVRSPVQTVTIETQDLAEPRDLWFSVTLAAPRDLDALVPVEVATQSLTVELGKSPPTAGALSLVLEGRVRHFGAGEAFWPVLKTTLRGQEVVLLPRLQRGSYRLTITREGMRRSRTLELGDAPLTLLFPDDFPSEAEP